MNRKLVSIIIPIYNIEKYIERCINSIINQTYENIEIILINDGSTDNSHNICLEFANKDNRINYYKIPNGGVSYARNFGLSKAKGEFITFIDGDDYVSNNYIETLIKYQYLKDYDIVISNAIDFNNNGIIHSKSICSNPIELDKEKTIYHFFKQDIFHSVCWGRLYKKKIIDNVSFDTRMRIAEDGKFFLSAIDISYKNVVIPERLYYYYIRENSTVHSSFNEKFYDELSFCDNLIKKYVTNKELYRLALLKKANFIFRCLRLNGIDQKTQEDLIEKFNEVYKKIEKKQLKLIIKKHIINNNILIKLI